jgi:hypothetical protein
MLCLKKRLYITRVANVGQRDLDIEYVANFESLKPRTLKENDDLGFAK